MICPVKVIANKCFIECDMSKCAWWCGWVKRCAMVALPAELSDRMHDLMKTMEEQQ